VKRRNGELLRLPERRALPGFCYTHGELAASLGVWGRILAVAPAHGSRRHWWINSDYVRVFGGTGPPLKAQSLHASGDSTSSISSEQTRNTAGFLRNLHLLDTKALCWYPLVRSSVTAISTTATAASLSLSRRRWPLIIRYPAGCSALALFVVPTPCSPGNSSSC